MLETFPTRHPTWSLRRVRRLPAGCQQDALRVRQVAQHCRLQSQELSYQGNVTRVRPTTALLLSAVWGDLTRCYTIHEITAALYGRPATVRSVRQVVFRANRDFERVGCPLILHCQALFVFVQYRPPRFRQPTIGAGRSLGFAGA